MRAKKCISDRIFPTSLEVLPAHQEALPRVRARHCEPWRNKKLGILERARKEILISEGARDGDVNRPPAEATPTYVVGRRGEAPHLHISIAAR